MITERQEQILALASDGYTTTRIARELGCSTRLVKLDLQQFMAQYGLLSRTHAVAVAIRSGWI